jgi:hypothetical protein
MTLGEMKAQFIALMNRNELKGTSPAATALVTIFMDNAILRIQRELRAPLMEKSILYTIPSTFVAGAGLAIPSDFLELIGIFVGPDLGYEIQREQLTKVRGLMRADGFHPLKFSRLGGNWLLGPAPKPGDQILFTYYASFPDFADDTDSNILSTSAWDLPIYGALSAACDYWNDPRFDRFEARYNQIALALQNMADGDELTADAAVTPVYPWPRDD